MECLTSVNLQTMSEPSPHNTDDVVVMRKSHAARRLGVTRQGVDYLIARGQLETIRFGGVEFVSVASVDAAAIARQAATTAA